MNRNLNEFVSVYKKSLTLRNGLLPIGNTLNNIKNMKPKDANGNEKESKNLIELDKELSLYYKKVKKIIDDLHRRFVDLALSSDAHKELQWEVLANKVNSHENKLKRFANDPITNSEAKQKEVKALQDDLSSMRKAIAKIFNKVKVKGKDQVEFGLSDVFSKKLFTEILPGQNLSEDELKLVKKFEKFTSYFTGFHENRKNIYSGEAQATAIPYRLVDDNFIKFLHNVEIYRIWLKLCPDTLKQAERAMLDNKILSKPLSETFTAANYGSILCQKDIDDFNCVIGGKAAAEGKQKVQGLNEYVNLAAQHDAELSEKLSNSKARKMGTLYKLILSESHSGFFMDLFQDDQEVIKAVKDFYQEQCKKDGIIQCLQKLMNGLGNYDQNCIFVNGKDIHKLSKALWDTDSWHKLSDCIADYLNSDKKFSKKSSKDDNYINKLISKNNFSLSELSRYCNEDVTSRISSCFNNKFAALLEANDGSWPEDLKTAESKQKLKLPLEALLNIYNFLKIFVTTESDTDLNFYQDFIENINKLSPISHLYNKTRNYATKKPYSLEKFKLNFGTPSLANGWSVNKEQDYLSLIFVKNGKLFLGIINKDDKTDFTKLSYEGLDSCYLKMRYILFKDLSKMLPKCTTQRNDVKKHFAVNDEPFSLYDEKTFNAPLLISKEVFDLNNVADDEAKKFSTAYLKSTGNTEEFKKALATWIDFAKDFLKVYKSTAQFDFSSLKNSSDYNNLADFYAEVDNITYKIEFEKISERTIDQLVDDGKLYLFQISNKDFSDNKGKKGTDNLHTMYLKNILSEENLRLGVIKLDGEAELFYREKSIDTANTVVHKKDSVLVNKIYYKDGKYEQIPDRIYSELYQNLNGNLSQDKLSEDARSLLPFVTYKKADYDIVKDRRFTEDKFFFHCPITINYKKADNFQKDFNDSVLRFLRNNQNINIIGIDRGERNLIYISVIDQKGAIILQKSFNVIANSDRKYSVDYQEKLKLREQNRKEAKQSWDSVQQIKTIKEGYLSAVIHEIAKLMIEYNAIAVLENLNSGFKRVRQGLSEKSVYQKFEKMLIDKLNYFVIKNRKPDEIGGVLKGYQLTNKLSSFKDLGFQSGFVFYVPSAYTSKIDPTTGFADILPLKSFSNAEKRKRFFSCFNEISYDTDRQMFKFSVDFNHKDLKPLVKTEKSKWDIFTNGKRLVRYKDKKDSSKYIEREIDLTSELKELFTSCGIDFSGGKDLIAEIQKIDDSKKDANFWDTLFKLFKATVQMRNSNNSEDYLISPVINSQGKFFNSNDGDTSLPLDADANGAYHIALKGLIILEKNNQLVDGKKLQLKIPNSEWFDFAQSRNN